MHNSTLLYRRYRPTLRYAPTANHRMLRDTAAGRPGRITSCQSLFIPCPNPVTDVYKNFFHFHIFHWL